MEFVIKLRGENLNGTNSNTDLGDSSEYTNENFVDWGGERFILNSNCKIVSRS